MKNLSNWRSVRLLEQSLENRLRRNHRLWLHGWCIGLLVLGAMWATSDLQMVWGSGSLGLRYAITLGVGYLIYLAVIRTWAGALVGERGSSFDAPSFDGLGDLRLPHGAGGSGGSVDMPVFRAG